MYAELKLIKCRDCGKEKPARFHNTAKVCRDCAKKTWAKNKAERRAIKRKQNPAAHKQKDFGYDLVKNYGISLEQYNALYVAQQGNCACCGMHESNFKRKLHVDHCHESGAIRGLLCTRCNPGLGYFQDSIERLELAIAYLRKFKN